MSLYRVTRHERVRVFLVVRDLIFQNSCINYLINNYSYNCIMPLAQRRMQFAVLYNTLFSREENFAKSEFEIFSREDIFANILFTGKFRAKSKFANIAKISTTRKIGVIQYSKYRFRQVKSKTQLLTISQVAKMLTLQW